MAAQEADPVHRMVHVMTTLMSGFYSVPKRMGKPFNPMLGETFELVAPDFRYFSEQVSHHPPIACFNIEGLNFRVQRQMETVQHFTGKCVKIHDKNSSMYCLKLPNGSTETYISNDPMMVVGNLFVGKLFIEPQGAAQMTCQDTGVTCQVEYRARSGWTTKPENENYVTATIKDARGIEVYKIQG